MAGQRQPLLSDLAISLSGDLRKCIRCDSSIPSAHCVEFSEAKTAQQLPFQLTYTNSEEAREQVSQLGCTSNVLFGARTNELATMSSVNMILSISSVMYVGVNIVCIILNAHLIVTDSIFHNLEFVSTFLFNITDLLALSYSPKKFSNQYSNPLILKMMVYINILCSWTSCLLVLVDLEAFETRAHELEYCNELTLAVFNFVILFSLMRSGQDKQKGESDRQCSSLIAIVLAFAIAAIQLGIYNLMGWTADGDSKGETLAHYFEFMFGILSASITFWFTMDNKLNADKQMFELMHSHHHSHA